MVALSFSTLLLALAVPAASTDVRSGLGRTLAWGLFINAANAITDFGHDGYGWISTMPDRHPFDGARYPLALDIPANGIDEDGYGGDLQLASGSPSLLSELKDSGYDIAVFSGHPEDFGDISETVGMRDNADIFIDGDKLKQLRAFGNGAQGSILIDEKHLLQAFGEKYAQPAKWDQPQFLYFNFQSPHFPYFREGLPLVLTDSPLPRPEISAANRERLQQTYWNASNA